MFGRRTNSDKPAAKRGANPSVIAAGMHVLGSIISDGALDIDGKIDGNVRGETITVRPNGAIRGDVVADIVHVYGEIRGLVKARVVMLYADSQVHGTIMHESVTIEDGAVVDGKLKRVERLMLGGSAEPMRRLPAPTVLSESDNDNDEPQSEAEIKILENLRLIS